MGEKAFRWLFLVFILVLGNGIPTYAQTTESGATSLPEFIKSMGLSKDKLEQTLKLTRDFLIQLQDANLELTKLMTPPASGSLPDAKAKEKLARLKLKFGEQMNKYHLDLEKLIGAAKALRIAEKVHLIIPQVLIEGLKMPGMNPKVTTTPPATPTKTSPANGAPTTNGTTDTANVNTILTGVTSSGTNNPASTSSTTTATSIISPTTIPSGNAPQEVPLGSTTSDASGSSGASSDLDLQVVGNSSTVSGHDSGMDSMMSMMGDGSMMSRMMGSMGNMSNGNNSQAASGLDLINRQLVLQLLANNANIIQMLATLSYQAGNENLPLLLQPIYQSLANQVSLLQMLYSNFNTAAISGQSGTGNSGSGGMGMM